MTLSHCSPPALESLCPGRHLTEKDMDRGLSKEQVLEWLGSCGSLVYQMLCWDTRGTFVDIHGLYTVLSCFISIFRFCSSIFWVLNAGEYRRTDGPVSIAQSSFFFCIAHSSFCAYPVGEHERQKLSKGNPICSIYKLRCS